MRYRKPQPSKRLISLLALALAAAASAFPAGKAWKIAIVTDTKQDFATKARDGFIDAMDALLAKRGDKAAYTVYDTELSETKASGIVDSLRSSAPDLVFTVNYPTGFADLNVTAKLKEPRYRFVSMNPIPVQTGVAASWDRPGGNVTGVSVFLRFNSQLRLMKRIRPEARKLVMFSWDAMKALNDWYAEEVRRACREEGVELVDFGLVPSIEAELDFLSNYANMGNEYFIFGIISAWIHADGSAATDLLKIETDLFSNRLRIPLLTYDENAGQSEALAGACVIWADIGAQAAEKGLKVLEGARPGDLAWEYPRKYNILLNLAVARRLGISFPQELINAAYRVYTDLDGHYAGQGN
jgi:putative tryptophan/tyrosine transport system substrate-binding protein